MENTSYTEYQNMSSHMNVIAIFIIAYEYDNTVLTTKDALGFYYNYNDNKIHIYF